MTDTSIKGRVLHRPFLERHVTSTHPHSAQHIFHFIATPYTKTLFQETFKKKELYTLYGVWGELKGRTGIRWREDEGPVRWVEFNFTDSLMIKRGRSVVARLPFDLAEQLIAFFQEMTLTPYPR